MALLRMMLPNGIVLHGQGEAVAEGFFITKDGLDWFDGVDVRRDEVSRPGAHGSFDSTGFLTSRVVQVEGVCVARSEAELAHMGAQLRGVLADGSRGRVQMVWDGLPLWVDVRLGAQTKFSPNRASLVGAFKLTFWAADPRLYGEGRVFGPASAVTVHHRGNFPAVPTCTVTGTAASGYTIHGPGGRQFIVTRALAAGQPHVIDMNEGVLRVGGVVQVGAVSRADTWAIPPGVPVAMSVTPDTAALSVLVRDTHV